MLSAGSAGNSGCACGTAPRGSAYGGGVRLLGFALVPGAMPARKPACVPSLHCYWLKRSIFPFSVSKSMSCGSRNEEGFNAGAEYCTHSCFDVAVVCR